MSKTVALTVFFAGVASSLRAGEPTAHDLEFFEKKIRPVLVEHCFKCHSSEAKRVKGGLRLDSREAMLKGGETGPALVPGQPAKSRLIEAVGYKNPDLQMPPRGKLPEVIVADLAEWIKRGAQWPIEKVAKEGGKYEFNLAKRKGEHWAWQPLRRPALPAIKDTAWPADPLDRFILARLEAANLKPAAPADRRTLIRRAYFDLVGLPPSSAEVNAFLEDSSPDAFAKVVDRLLASPHFGERWGRHWLDLVRYGESRGHEFDYTNPNAYQYRDYVIRAFNADVTYDQFIVEHLAGDLLETPRLHHEKRFNESILGTGFWHLGEQVHSPVDICQDKADRFDNMLDVMSKTFLGLTVACARCHDHKFDAISTKDYYSLAGFLESSNYRLARFDTLAAERRLAEDLQVLRERGQVSLQKALAAAARPTAERLADYLVAARDLIRSPGKPANPGLDPSIVEMWVDFLGHKTRDENDPFQLWSMLCHETNGKLAAPDHFPIKDARQSPDHLRELDVIVDYSRPSAESWLPDGWAFGLKPARAGELISGPQTLYLAERAVAVADPLWDRLQIAPDSESDPGRLGGRVRAGRTLCTPTFEIKSGKVFFLIKGAGQAYASVEAHVMISGPLHGQLVRPIKTGPGLQWLEYDLRPYRGRRAHLEFTPAEGADLAIAMVAQGDRLPELPAESNRLFARALSAAAPRTIDSIAQSYQAFFEELLRRLESNTIKGSSDAAEYSRLANWLLHQPDLFAAREQVERTTNELRAEQAMLVAVTNLDSRLALAMRDGNAVNERVFIRGNYKTPGELAPRRFLEALAGPDALPVRHGSGRLELARQMIDPKLNPFLPRVMVNRVWHHLFGRGIVASVDNFGVLGESPTHPELLDFLAARFVEEGWSIKKMIRALVLSQAYQMSSEKSEAGEQVDAENRLWHRRKLRRLEGEAIRDAILAVSGRLNDRLYGRSVPVFLTEFQDGRGRPASGPLDGDGRRSLYLAIRRNFLSPFLLAFDAPIPFSSVGRRTISNVPAQALILMNDPFVHQQAEVWARRMLADNSSAKERITSMYLSAFCRPPTADELASCLDFLSSSAGHQPPDANDLARWTSLAHVLYNAKEFIYVN